MIGFKTDRLINGVQKCLYNVKYYKIKMYRTSSRGSSSLQKFMETWKMLQNLGDRSKLTTNLRVTSVISVSYIIKSISRLKSKLCKYRVDPLKMFGRSYLRPLRILHNTPLLSSFSKIICQQNAPEF